MRFRAVVDSAQVAILALGLLVRRQQTGEWCRGTKLLEPEPKAAPPVQAPEQPGGGGQDEECAHQCRHGSNCSTIQFQPLWAVLTATDKIQPLSTPGGSADGAAQPVYAIPGDPPGPATAISSVVLKRAA